MRLGKYMWHQHMRSHTTTHKYKQAQAILAGILYVKQAGALQHKTAVKKMDDCCVKKINHHM